MRIVRMLLAIICFILALLFLAVFMVGSTDDGSRIIGIVFTLIFVVAGLLVKPEPLDKTGMKQRAKQWGAIVSDTALHAGGLPIIMKSICLIAFTGKQFIIEGGGAFFILELPQIVRAELQAAQQTVYSLDGRLMTRPVYYLVIHYTGEANQSASMSFDAGSKPTWAMKTLLNELQKAAMQNAPQAAGL